MQSLLEQIKGGRIWQMFGGVHPPQRKKQSNQTKIERLPMADKIYLPLKQHIGALGNLTVAKNDVVFKGQPLTNGQNTFALPVHAPTSGKVVDIIEHVSNHPSGIKEQTLVIEPDGQDVWLRMPPLKDEQLIDKPSVVERIRQAGISGMGGAGFPTHIKTGTQKNVDFLLINGAECEPYITSDDRLMREHAEEIIQGIEILNYLLNPQKVVIGIEDNKPEAIQAMQQVIADKEHIVIRELPTIYPMGGEKQLIQVLTGRQVPKGQLPVDMGLVMQNVATCFAISRAVNHGEALVERVVTITGKALNKPGNYWLPLGTPVTHALKHCGHDRQDMHRVIIGGPMMGYSAVSDDVPVIKTTNCILVPTVSEMPPPGDEMACIRCGQCADACPAQLLPQQLYWYSKSKEYDKAEEYNLSDCIECGACAFVCPSQIPLVQYYRVAKADIKQQKADKEKSDKAKLRFEARQERMEKERIEREEKHRKAAEARRSAQSGSDKQAAIAAAMARAKAKKAQQGEAAETPPADTGSSKNAAVQAAIERAKAKKAAQQAEQQDNSTQADNDGQDKRKAAIEAAIAKAKAKQAAAQADDSAETVQQDTDSSADKKKAAVAAAIAKAKAKQAAAKAEQESDNVDASEGTSPQSPEDKKKAAVAAAIAKAKAKQAAAKAESDSEDAPKAEGSNADSSATETPTEQSPEDKKKAAVAAAIAKAKAKQAAAKAESDSADEAKTEDANADSSAAETPLEQSREDKKKAAVAAAIAKAKAKQAAAKAESDSADEVETEDANADSSKAETSVEQSREDKKKAAVAAAIAKAKAKRAAAKAEADKDNGDQE